MKAFVIILCAVAFLAPVKAEISIDSFMGFQLGKVHSFSCKPDEKPCRWSIYPARSYTKQIASGESVRVETDESGVVLVVSHCYKFNAKDNVASFVLDTVNSLEKKYGIKMNKSQYTRYDHNWWYGDGCFNLTVRCVFDDMDDTVVEIEVHKKIPKKAIVKDIEKITK